MDIATVVDVLRELSHAIRSQVLKACHEQSIEQLASVSEQSHEDTIFAIDRVSESVLLSELTPRASRLGGMVLIAEGLSESELTLPESLAPEQARWRVILDPIDGTRGLMYQKRSAWLLAAVAPNRGAETRLSDVQAAVQTELPTLKGAASDELWALVGEGARAERYWLESGRREPMTLAPSRASSIENGYAMLTRFFPGARDELAAIDDAVVERVLGQSPAGSALCFEEQYASTGGQLYELMVGHDRFNADLRPLMKPLLTQRSRAPGLCCHPYDVCTALIAQQAGVILTAPGGGPLDVPLDLDTNVAWVGYANAEIRRQVEPALHEVLEHRGWLK